MKRCGHCNIVKEDDQFYTSTLHGKPLTYSWCKSCMSAREKTPERIKYNKDRHVARVQSGYYRERSAEPELKAYKNFLKYVKNSAKWKKVISHYCEDGVCPCCGKKSVIVVDHVVPFSKGGKNEWSNVQPICKECNAAKGLATMDYRPDKGKFITDLLAKRQRAL